MHAPDGMVTWPSKSPEWTVWQHDEVIYQVDPSLFQDSDGDGRGDLRGVIRRLPYLRSLGVSTLWLLPFYRSPFRDHGYDVSDHLQVDRRFGDIADFAALLERAEGLGMRVIIELVMQHTSDRHPWFQAARSDRRSPYHDYYIWSDEPLDGPEPMFPGVEDSAWTWDSSARRYYRHRFYSHEPDLELANPRVRDEMYRIMAYWLRLGVAGFRVDAAPYMVERACLDDPRHDGLWLLEDMHRFARRRVPGAVLLGEADVDVERYGDYLADGRRLTHLLDFWTNNHVFLALAREQAAPLQSALTRHHSPPANARYAMWLRNHDELDLGQLEPAERDEVRAAFAPEPSMWIYDRGIRRRLAPMLGGDQARTTMAHALLASLPGVPVLRYGDEIGMGEDLSLSERNSVRTPMQWSAERNGGFSDAAASELVAPMVADDAYAPARRNVEEQAWRHGSLLDAIRDMLRARIALPEFRGRCRGAKFDCAAVLGLRYDAEDGGCVLAFVNLSPEPQRFEVREDDVGRAVDVLRDRDYAPPQGRPLAVDVARYGYRWLRACD